MNLDRKYPIGRFVLPQEFTTDTIDRLIGEISAFPTLLRAEIAKLDEIGIDTPYREGGWTVRQVLHHCADSHMNSFIRFKLALTEDNPTIKGYDEGAWALLPDVAQVPVEASIQLLESLHARWVMLLKHLGEEEFAMTFFHPEKQKAIRLDETLALYAWHGKHHLAHVQLVSGSLG
jgi:uncharacterized damage-inducible protein DinB